MIDDERLLTMDDKWRCRLSDILLKLVCAHITIRQPKEADETLDNQNPTKHANISVNNAVNIKMYSYLHLLHFHVSILSFHIYTVYISHSCQYTNLGKLGLFFNSAQWFGKLHQQ